MAATDQEHVCCCSKFLLEPREASMFDLSTLLFSSAVANPKFVSGDEKIRDFNRRWLIFASVLVQKILLLVEKPLSLFGDAIELSLNLISSNGGGLLKLFINLLKWKVVWPDKSSAAYVSVVGYLDRRVELDKNIGVGDKKYKQSLALMASKVAYENEAFTKSVVQNHWKMDFVGFYNFWNDYEQDASTQAFIFQDTKADPNLIVVAFRGTSPCNALDWCTDLDLSWYELEGVGKVHRGFMRALGQQKDGSFPKQLQKDANNNHTYAYYAIKQMLKDLLLKHENAKLIVTGHSLGGALAILLASVLAIHDERSLLDRLDGVYTFGQPRVGDEKFGVFTEGKFRECGVRYERFVYSNDLVPRLPYDDRTTMYKHFGVCLYHDSWYRGAVVAEEPNRNYFSLVWVAPKVLNAGWEMVRGFLLPVVAGSDYREGWFLRLFRVVGLIVPGLSAHIPQNYNNSMRLGSWKDPAKKKDVASL